MTIIPTWLLFACFATAGLGAWLGDMRNRMIEGAIVGFLLGPIGCIIAVMMPEPPTNKTK